MTMKGGRSKKKRADTFDGSLTGLVFSWSLNDIFNEKLYKDKVKTIPETFESVEDYFEIYVHPLLEETRAELQSSFESISRAPFAEITSLEAKNEEYNVRVDRWENRFSERGKLPYRTLPGDIFIVSDAKPETVSDLQRPGWNWTYASVTGIPDDDENGRSNSSTQFVVKTFKDIEVENWRKSSWFVVFLMNITTNARIWQALHMSASANRKIIKQVLSANTMVQRSCNMHCERDNVTWAEQFRSSLSSILNKSQSKMKCHHKPSVELIWGPPGTGKTKTVSMLLSTLLQKVGCRILTCAPTNVAITELASRVLQLVKDSFKETHNKRSFSLCSLGDILLFGNKDRLRVGYGIEEIYLDYRVDRLKECVAPLTGWRHCFTSIIDLLEDCVSEYHIFLQNQLTTERTLGNAKGSKKGYKSFLQFTRKRFKVTAEPLRRCLFIMGTHIPKSFLLESNFRQMVSLIDSLYSFEILLFDKYMNSQKLEDLFSNDPSAPMSPILLERCKCIRLSTELRLSLGDLKLPTTLSKAAIRDLCFQNASLFFCTASSSYKFHKVSVDPLDLLVIDEAAQLKECESAIPLQIRGINHAVLIGDECQLPAMVNSKVSEEAGYGRSLFERLSFLGHEKHLLDIQYRMHPSISAFPNSKFYHNQIFDAPNVKKKSYTKNYLLGPMFGPYSFINIFGCKEEVDDITHSRRNMVEVAVAVEVVRKLYKGMLIRTIMFVLAS